MQVGQQWRQNVALEAGAAGNVDGLRGGREIWREKQRWAVFHGGLVDGACEWDCSRCSRCIWLGTEFVPKRHNVL